MAASLSKCQKVNYAFKHENELSCTCFAIKQRKNICRMHEKYADVY